MPLLQNVAFMWTDPTERRQNDWIFTAPPINYLGSIWWGLGEGHWLRHLKLSPCYEIHGINIPAWTSKGKERCCHTLELILNLQAFSAAYYHASSLFHKSKVPFPSFCCHQIIPKQLDSFSLHLEDVFGMSWLETTGPGVCKQESPFRRPQRARKMRYERYL